ncbi:CAP domain-containing protein [Amycolatopsis suaedae]|uniref:CAP domain-containing protein n=1 Tax=Amycolatopsis suaedae TaxID=2510978 RepID=UPI001F0DCD27|nr:CAP domain-containing protein [Amycolatopsis suaedae]
MTKTRHRRKSLLVALSVLVGVTLAAGGTLWFREPQGSAPAELAAARTPVEPGGAEAGAGIPRRHTPAPPPVTTTTQPPATTTSAPPTTSSSAKPPTSSTPPKHGSAGERGDRVLELVNIERGKAGCDPVRADDRLDTSAQKHSEDMSAKDYFSHTSQDGTTFDQRIKAAGYPKPGAENIAKGTPDADQVMELWMKSDGHRRNILNCKLTALGVGVATDGWYWTQNFGY